MSMLSSAVNRGILNLPGADAASKAAAEQLLKKDHDTHHCYFRAAGLHNHLSHHILAAYDLGAPASLLQAIYDEEAKIQRPIDLKENGVVPEGLPKKGEIKQDNWTTRLGDAKAYSAYLSFFSDRVAQLGVVKSLEEYIFSPAANGNGSNMLLRLVAGALHPFIQVGYGLEFGSEIQVAAGLAQAAIHEPRAEAFISPEEFIKRPSGDKYQPPSIFSILRQIYDSPKLVPVLPYEPDALLSKRVKDFLAGGARLAELKRILAELDLGETPNDLDARVEELVFASTLLTFSSGRKNRKPRLDFFLMHLLTSSLFVPSFFKYLPSLENKKALFRTYFQPWGIILMTRGRPRFDASLLMSYPDHPVPPNAPKPNLDSSAIGGDGVEESNPWPAIVADAIHAPDSHTIKALRTLLYGATRYGTVRKGEIVGASEDGKETHPGIQEADGTIFVRAAGVLMDSLGWVTHGQAAEDWDRSALGWDDAWKGE